MRGEVRSEWDELKQHDVLFLMTIRPPDAMQLQVSHLLWVRLLKVRLGQVRAG